MLRWLPALLLAACTPAYHAPSHHAALFDGPRQFSARGSLGLGGAQLQAAYSVVDHLAIRVGGHGYADNRGPMVLGGGGLEAFATYSRFRVSGGAEFHAGYIDKFFPARSELFITRNEVETVGPTFQVAIPYTAAWEWPAVATGITGRGLWHGHPVKPSWQNINGGPYGGILAIEGAYFVRWGRQRVKGDFQAGISVPIGTTDGGNRNYVPLNLALGLIVDL